MNITKALEDFGSVENFSTISDLIWEKCGIDDRFMVIMDKKETPTKNIIMFLIPMTHISAECDENDDELKRLHQLPPTTKNITDFLATAKGKLRHTFVP